MWFRCIQFVGAIVLVLAGMIGLWKEVPFSTFVLFVGLFGVLVTA